jgi:hypothetical protein
MHGDTPDFICRLKRLDWGAAGNLSEFDLVMIKFRPQLTQARILSKNAKGVAPPKKIFPDTRHAFFPFTESSPRPRTLDFRPYFQLGQLTGHFCIDRSHRKFAAVTGQ